MSERERKRPRVDGRTSMTELSDEVVEHHEVALLRTGETKPWAYARLATDLIEASKGLPMAAAPDVPGSDPISAAMCRMQTSNFTEQERDRSWTAAPPACSDRQDRYFGRRRRSRGKGRDHPCPGIKRLPRSATSQANRGPRDRRSTRHPRRKLTDHH